MHIVNNFFYLQAILLWTINDFLAYGNFLDYNVKWHKASHVCEEGTFSIQLKHEKRQYILVPGDLAHVPLLSEATQGV